MSVHCSVEVREGRPVTVRRADPASGDELRRCGERLQEAARAGVVPVVASGPTAEGGWALTTELGGTPLPRTPVPAGALAALGAELAALLADLHEDGIVHGAVGPDTVLLGRDGRPQLGLLAPTPTAPAQDVRGLAQVLLDRVDQQRPGAPALVQLLTAALADDAPPPTMRRLARDLGHLGGPPPAPTGPPPRSAPRPGRSSRTRLAAAAGVPAVLLSVGLLARGAVARPADPPSPTSSSTVPIATTPARPTCAVSSARAPGPTGPTCRHALAVEDDVITVDGRRYRVGRPGDLLAAGSFRCRGEVTVVALRPTTGEVFVFDEIGPSAVEVPALVRIPGADGLVPVTISERCQQLRVRHGADQTPLPLEDER